MAEAPHLEKLRLLIGGYDRLNAPERGVPMSRRTSVLVNYVNPAAGAYPDNLE
jgi:hypothetical protein